MHKVKDNGLKWPPDELSAYNFLKVHAGPTALPSRASQFLESAKFPHYVLGYKIPDVVESVRPAGFAEEQRGILGGRIQAPALDVAAVKSMELAMESNVLDESETLVVGAALVLLALRSRFNDFSALELKIGQEEFEVAVEKTKTARSKSRLGLIMIGPTELTNGDGWLKNYLEKTSD